MTKKENDKIENLETEVENNETSGAIDSKADSAPASNQKAGKSNARPKEPEIPKLSQAEWNRRIKLDVSDPEYINPSLGHGK